MRTIYHKPPAPRVEARREETEPACVDRWWPFDQLIEYKHPDADVILEVLEMCNACPLVKTCHRESAAEPWYRQLNTRHARDVVRNARRLWFARQTALKKAGHRLQPEDTLPKGLPV